MHSACALSVARMSCEGDLDIPVCIIPVQVSMYGEWAIEV
jgi:hypothetical protein